MAPAAVIVGAGAKAATARRHRAAVEMAAARVVERERTLLMGAATGTATGAATDLRGRLTLAKRVVRLVGRR